MQAADSARAVKPRFRPNLVIESTGGSKGFVENAWIRCTLRRQGRLPKAPDVLRAAVQQNAGNVGVYATVVQPGLVCGGIH
jgi:hypothetical protein